MSPAKAGFLSDSCSTVLHLEAKASAPAPDSMCMCSHTFTLVPPWAYSEDTTGFPSVKQTDISKLSFHNHSEIYSSRQNTGVPETSRQNLRA